MRLLRRALSPIMCRFLGRRVAAFELRAFFAGVREAPRHEIAGAVHGWFSAVLWGIGAGAAGVEAA